MLLLIILLLNGPINVISLKYGGFKLLDQHQQNHLVLNVDGTRQLNITSTKELLTLQFIINVLFMLLLSVKNITWFSFLETCQNDDSSIHFFLVYTSISTSSHLVFLLFVVVYCLSLSVSLMFAVSMTKKFFFIYCFFFSNLIIFFVRKSWSLTSMIIANISWPFFKFHYYPIYLKF